jgi:carboxylesterase
MTATSAPNGFASDWSANGSGVNREIGIVLVHGYTGSPSAMRPWAEYLNQKGYTVRVPLLPGHGTKPEDLHEIKWQQWPAKVESELAELWKSCTKVFICGFSMGGGTTLHVAGRNSSALSGIILVNPMIHIPFVGTKLAYLYSRIQKFRNSSGDDIKRPGVTQGGYDAMSTRGIYQILQMLKYTRANLHKVKVPLQLFHSVDDHTLPASNTKIVLRGVGSPVKERIELTNSYHVATLDYDAEIIFEKSLLFIKSHST